MIDLDKIATEIPQLRRGKVWCRTCRSERSMGGENGLRNGWPKCCGYTMTIDSPEEQTRLRTLAEKG